MTAQWAATTPSCETIEKPYPPPRRRNQCFDVHCGASPKLVKRVKALSVMLRNLGSLLHATRPSRPASVTTSSAVSKVFHAPRIIASLLLPNCSPGGSPNQRPATKGALSASSPLARSDATETIACGSGTQRLNSDIRTPSPPIPVGRKLLLNNPAP